jgi:biotin-[acetyl-CoA-carboxylase] ligase BirA-like protein
MPTHPTSFDLSRLRAGVKPFRLHWFPRLRSTNDHAAILRKRGELFAPALVLTGHQLAGRGRGSNSWWSGDGSVTATFVFAADEHLAPYHVPLIAGLAVRTAAAELTANDDIQLKWPNDLLYHNRKLAGLLCERVYKADLIGIGLNVNINRAQVPASLRDRVTSLNEIAKQQFQHSMLPSKPRTYIQGFAQHSRRPGSSEYLRTWRGGDETTSTQPVDMTDALILIARHLHRMLSHRDEQSFASVLQEYDRHHALLGKRVTVQAGGEEPRITGRCEGLDDMGRLLLRDRRTLHRVIAGQVQAI